MMVTFHPSPAPLYHSLPPLPNSLTPFPLSLFPSLRPSPPFIPPSLLPRFPPSFLSLKKLCWVCYLLLEESNVQPVSTPIIVCGDIHGQVRSLCMPSSLCVHIYIYMCMYACDMHVLLCVCVCVCVHAGV